MVDREAVRRASSTAIATTTCPTTPRPGACVAAGLDEVARARGADSFAAANDEQRFEICADFAEGELTGGVWEEISCAKAWGVVMRGVLAAVLLPPLGMERDRLRRPGLPPRLHAPGSGTSASPTRGRRSEARIRSGRCGGGGCREAAAHAAKGGLGPVDNDSRYLLDPHRRGIPGRDAMASYRDDDEVDLVIVGAGAGGSTLAQRLARRGWRIVIARVGPVLGSRPRLGLRRGRLPQALLDRPSRDRRRGPGGAGQEQLRPRGRRLDGPLRRLHAALPSLRLRGPDARRRRRRLADLLPGAEAALRAGRARSCRSPGRTGPGATRTAIPTAPIRSRGEPIVPAPGPVRRGSRCAIGPVGIPNGTFGNRPHCIYRGFCLQGCKVNAKASPLVTHLPDAIEHGVEIRADSHVVRVETDGRSMHRRHLLTAAGEERFQRAAAVAVAGYSIETPRLLLNSTSAALPERPRQRLTIRSGATSWSRARRRSPAASPTRCGCTRRRPPRSPPSSSTRPTQSRGFARGFSIQTVGPQPIGWAEHVLADGHWGTALREYMRDYNHWSTLGVLNELLPLPENRVTTRGRERQPRHAGRAHGLHPVRQRPREHRLREADARADLGGGGRPGHADDRPLRPPRRRLPDGDLARPRA